MQFFFLIAAALIIFALVGGGLSFAPWVPTRKRDLERINGFIGLKPGETLYELGCGDGRVCHSLAKKNRQSNIVGIEISPLLFAIARLRQVISPLPNLKLVRANIFTMDLTDGDVFYTFGMNDKLGRLRQKLLEDRLHPARLISYAFHIPGHEPTRVSGKEGNDTRLFEYQIMLPKAS